MATSSSSDGSKRGEPEEPVKVVDRRHFDASGNVRTSEPEPVVKPAAMPPPAAPDRAAAGALEPADQAFPPIDFASFLMSLSVQALMALGAAAPHGKEPPPPNLDAARELIDILTLLQKKTEGNRTTEETQVLESSLYELRLRYVDLVRGGEKTS